ncbi:MAG: ATP synthase F0 subunit B [Deltaproteobacteria bacterium]|nr:ATP synthase F0 subunit B [Deltaproteobacteria bacterium]
MELNVTFVIQLVAFLFTVLLVSNVAFGPILATLDERHKRIEGAQAEAARLAQASGSSAGVIEKKLADARAAGQDEMAKLKTDGEKAEAELVHKAKEESARKVAEARTAIQAATEKARTELGSQAQALAESIAAKALGRNA